MREFNANRLKSKGKPVVQKQVVVPKAEQKVPQAKESPASIAARKRFNDRLKRQTAIYNKTKPTTANQKGIPPSAIKEMQDANKKMQAKVFGGGKNPTSKKTFART
jgi:RAB protein geranylgeranyltransferase component A